MRQIAMAPSNDLKCFYKKTFYLDLKHFRNEAELMKDIKKFGGKIESFLSKDVNYVISDRPEVKPKIESWYPETPNSNATLMSPTEQHKSPFGFMHSPALGSPFNDKGKGAIMSRGLALVQKAKQKSGGTGDVLGICSQWKIKVVHVQVVTFFINKQKNLYKRKEQERKKTAGQQLPMQYKLSPPFVKVEDVNMQYRAHYKELKTKDAVFTSDLCHACKQLCKDYHLGELDLERSRSSVLKEVNTPRRDQHSPITVSFTPVIHKNFSSSSVFKKQFGSKMGLMNDSNGNLENESYFKNESKENAIKIPPVKRKKEHKGSSDSLKNGKRHLKHRYCEICQTTYQDLAVHISTQLHENYINDSHNFRDLQEIISTMPGLDSFMEKIEKERQELLQEPKFRSLESNHIHVSEAKESTCKILKPHPIRTPLLNCEENFSDIAKCIEQPEPETTKDAISAAVGHPYSIHSPGQFAVAVDNILENQIRPLGGVDNLHITPKASIHPDAQCEDLDNEDYNAVTEEYVSASCSTSESNLLAYLEDSADNLVSLKKGSCDNIVSPAILPKESPVISCNRPLVFSTFHCCDSDASGHALDLTSKARDLDLDAAAVSSFQVGTTVKIETVQGGCHGSLPVLDLSLPPPEFSTVFSCIPSAEKNLSNFSLNETKHLEIPDDTGTMTVKCIKESSHGNRDGECFENGTLNNALNNSVEILQNCYQNQLCVPNPAPDLPLSVKSDAKVELQHGGVNCEIQNYQDGICENQTSQCPLVPICSETKILEVSQSRGYCNEQGLHPTQNIAGLICNEHLELKSCTELQHVKAMSPLPIAVCSEKTPLLQECPLQIKEHERSPFKIDSVTTPLSHFVVRKSPLKDVSHSTGCNEYCIVEPVNSCIAGPPTGTVDENDQSYHCCAMDLTPAGISAAFIYDPNHLNDATCDAVGPNMPVLEPICCISDDSGQVEYMNKDLPVLEPNIMNTEPEAPELNIDQDITPVVQSPNLDSQEVTVEQHPANFSGTGLETVPVRMNGSPNRIAEVECSGEMDVPNCDILSNKTVNKQECVLKSVEIDKNQNEPLCVKDSVAQIVFNSASEPFRCSKLPDSPSDVCDFKFDSDHHDKTTVYSGLREVGLEVRLNLPLSLKSSEPLEPQKDMNDCKSESSSAAVPSETGVKLSGLPTQTSPSHVRVFNFSVNHSSVASDTTDAAKWVSECDISTDSEPEWENLKSNVDSLCQELERLNSEPDVTTEFPLNLAFI